MKFVIFPDGRRVDIDGGWYSIYNTAAVRLNPLNGNAYDFYCLSAGAAQAFLLAIDAFIASTDNISANPVNDGGYSSLTWISVTPNSYVTGDPLVNYEIAGTGFVTSGITVMQTRLDSNPLVTNDSAITINSDISITMDVNSNTYDNLGAYTIFYSINGTDWITTGLSFTVS